MTMFFMALTIPPGLAKCHIFCGNKHWWSWIKMGNYKTLPCQLFKWCKDGWISDEWNAHPLQPLRPKSTHQETLFTPVNPSLLHFTQDSQVPMNPLWAKAFKLTVMWWYLATMVLRGLNTGGGLCRLDKAWAGEMRRGVGRRIDGLAT